MSPNEIEELMECIPHTDIYLKDVDKCHSITKGNRVIYYIQLKNNGGRCLNCGKYTTKVKDYRKRRLHHDEGVLIDYNQRRFICECHKTFYEINPFCSEFKKFTDHLIQKVLLELKRYNHTFSEVASKFDISTTSVQEIFDKHVQPERKALREVISIDEFYFSRRQRSNKGKYAFMILGLNGEILDILDSRHKYYLLDHFKYIPLEERLRVKYVTMDMNAIYREVIHRRFKNATIVIDSFHVMKAVNDALDSIRKITLKKYEENKKSDEYYLLKYKRSVLFKDDLEDEYEYNKHFKRKMNEKDYLNLILKIDPVLTESFKVAKKYYYYNHYYDEVNEEEAYLFIEEYIKECHSLELEAFNKLATSFINWKKEIAASFKLYSRRNGEVIRLTNGKIEGKNSYIKKLLRLANGYENFDRFRNRAMYVENLNDKASIEPINKPVRKKKKKKKT